MDEKELAEYVIQRILDGDVFFLTNDHITSLLKETSPTVKFESTNEQVKLRGFDGTYKLHFIKKDEEFKKYSLGMVMGAGANFETLLGMFLEGQRPAHIHVYYIGSGFDLDKLSEMIYSLFTELGQDIIKEVSRAIVYNVQDK